MRVNKLLIRTLAATVTVLGVTIAIAAIPAVSPKDRAAKWAKGLGTAELRTFLPPERLSGLPVEYRKAVFNSLTSADDRTAFWQSVFANFRAVHTLTGEQHLTLARAEQMIPVMFKSAPTDRVALERALATVSEEVKRILGPDAQRELFLTAGADGRVDSLSRRERAILQTAKWSQVNPAGRLISRVAPALSAEGDCNCNDSQDDCTYYMHCTGGLNNCSQSGGCACEWIIFNCWTCDGVCNYSVIDD